MKKYLALILTLSFGLSSVWAQNNWKMHTTFEEEVSRVLDTPKFVYFTSRNMAQNNTTDTYFSLFRYEKEGNEVVSLSSDNYLSGNLISDLIYNPEKGNLVIVYRDYDIDILNDDGSLTRVQSYKHSNLSSSKKVNGMTIDQAKNLVYLATDFGFVTININKAEVAESRIYGEPLISFARIGDKYVALKDKSILSAPTSSAIYNLNDFDVIATDIMGEAIFPLNDTQFILKYNNGRKTNLRLATLSDSGLEMREFIEGPIYNIENYKNGVGITTSDRIYNVDRDGQSSYITIPENYRHGAATSSDFNEMWIGKMRKGLASLKKSGEDWALTRDYMRPNAPAVFMWTTGLPDTEKGFITANFGTTGNGYNFSQGKTHLISVYNNGRWSNYGAAYTRPELEYIMEAPQGIAIDPFNSSYVYLTSVKNSILRLNLDNPDDILHIANENNEDAANPWFVSLRPAATNITRYMCHSTPRFDRFGNMWTYYANFDDQSKMNIYVWTADDRRASTSAANTKLPILIEEKLPLTVEIRSEIYPLHKTGNGVLAFNSNSWSENLVVIDTNGTYNNSTDDKVHHINSFVDADGNYVECRYIRFMWEDPATGYVWVGHENGLFYFVPSQVLKGDYHINRIKVARNDGTNLADYLLDNVIVTAMTKDGQNRKWFGTTGGGLVCTTADGREILTTIDTSNSPLPDDNVIGLAYNAKTNSLLISTEGGTAEYFLPGSQQQSQKSDVRAYPNPVRPDFSNYVTITDIPEGSLVKIVDGGGNLVKELGLMSGSEIYWDVSDSNFRRVKSGVYYILVSPANENSSYSAVGKILVVS